MFPLKCPVRKCVQDLTATSGGLACDAGHSFDRAKEGYISLVQPQDRKSLKAGDSDDAVLARRRWIQRGGGFGLVEELTPWIQQCCLGSPHKPEEFSEQSSEVALSDKSQATNVVDLGCGEGSFGRLLCQPHNLDYCGIELSKRAIKLAARSWSEATWVLANADRPLPIKDQSVELVLSLFGRRPEAEIHRVLRPGGYAIVAVPGEEDLIELREHVQETGHRRRRSDAVIEQFEIAGIHCTSKILWTHSVELEPAAIADAMAMTYRAVRRSQQQRLTNLSCTSVTLAADLMLLERPGNR